MKKYLLYFSLLFILGISVSCSESSERTSDVAAAYELKIVDSVQVNLLSSGLNIADVKDETGEILAYQTRPPVAYILNPEGKVLKTMDRPSADPQAVGDYLLSGEFYEDGIALMGRTQVKTYDMDFNFRKSTKAHINYSGMIHMGLNQVFEIKGKDHNRLLAYMGPETDLGAHLPEFYKEFKVATIVDPHLAGEENLTPENLDKEVYKPIGGLTDDSRYVSTGKAFYFMKPVIDVRENMLYYAYEDDTSLFTVSLPSGELVEKIRIPFDNFILFEGYTMGEAGFKEQMEPRDWSGKISKLYKVGDFEVLIYSSGIKLKDVQALDPDSPDFREKISKANPQKHLILKNGVRMNSNLSLPEKITYFDMADNEGFLWAHQDISKLEEEPDLITFYKLKVVEVK